MQANEEEDPEQSRYTNLKEAASAVSKSFALCINDRSPERSSKKWGVYRISGILFRIYFKINQLNLCRNVIKGIRYAVLPPLTRFPKGDQVTYAYYVGRLEFTEENFDLAEAELLKAFRLCTIRAVHNKELILQYLVPVRLLRGVLPSNELLARYPTMRETYGAIVDALRHGNVKEFSDALSASEETLLRQGTYFTVDRARTVGLRHLFRLVHKIVGSTRVPIPRFKDALQFVGVQATMEETEWELATMIYNGYIKGYLSHERLMIVLSSTDPFPFPLPALTT
ncbi:hypothetical protein BC940DRAFT_246897 [Gongronella butleri]|nr:hypothetical protein BC940DRAFT_246897 [Gongronella butleri]